MNESQEGIDAFAGFFQQFGPPDVYTITLMEILFEELLNNSAEKENND
jgi:hypothetical protein